MVCKSSFKHHSHFSHSGKLSRSLRSLPEGRMSKRKCFSLAEKAEIVEQAKEFHDTKVDLAKSLDIAYSSLQMILKQEASVELSAEKLGKSAKKRKNS
ncbi:hypothetical protein AVEN_50511-1 [Araneus ventricosus]|uniref:HTH psq-type domain-containing protein n=1 Tax=Araneus ventricosus TaxID=182803 RepID=A0A4Y2AQ85_ARAVE|nr:hypothetical protein AVEN_50511-1 [Araneus ventricosus]